MIRHHRNAGADDLAYCGACSSGGGDGRAHSPFGDDYRTVVFFGDIIRISPSTGRRLSDPPKTQDVKQKHTKA